jgi:hypothetical protein
VAEGVTAMLQTASDPLLEWLYHVGPVGLVIGPNIIRAENLTAPPQTAVDNKAVEQLLADPDGADAPALPDPWAFFESVLGWEARYVAGAPGGPQLSDALAARVAEHDVVLAPDWAVRELGEAGGYQLLVQLRTDVDAEKAGPADGWTASARLQFERLLRETQVPIGVLVDKAHVILVYAPRGETSGWLRFPLRSLATVAGRAMLGGLKLMLGHARLFTAPTHLRLPALLARSREAQNEVSIELAGQVLGALHELLRAFHRADPERIERLATKEPEHLYEGLLSTLLRLVFLLYAEDRELLPTRREGDGGAIYDESYSVRRLYQKLTEDRALNPDTMDERVGGWGRLLALFRLVHGGHASGWIAARKGKLFDPQAFPFLEGRDPGSGLEDAQVLAVRDGAVLRILEGLMTIEARSVTGERVRERLSYRSLDVEQIGSVYETVMGFKVLRAPGPMLCVKGEKRLPVFVDIAALAAKAGKERRKLLKAQGIAPSKPRLKAIADARGEAALTEALAAIVDERGSPKGHVAAAGAPVLQPTDERRRSGSHYTPRSLTEPIVRHALEPAFARLGPEAKPDEVLELKVCDPACGSGAFLVEACRQIGARLQEAWGRHAKLKPTIPADEDEELHARRLVAQRCLYGVDKNPLATDLAKLSLWLATLAREHEFTFLDHALKSGDSLVGLTLDQIKATHWNSSQPPTLVGKLVSDHLRDAEKGRNEIRERAEFEDETSLRGRLRAVDAKTDVARLIGDAVVATFFAEDNARARSARLEGLLRKDIVDHLGRPTWVQAVEPYRATLRQGDRPVTPFHWEIEFPEVFSRNNPGFDAIVGNPPFAGKNTTIAANRKGYLDWLKTIHEGAHGNADLVAHFFRRAFGLIRKDGRFGLIATNTIGQGDTRATGLHAIIGQGGAVARAVRRLKWPGEAAVVVSVVHVAKGEIASPVLNGRQVRRVSAYLVDGDRDGSPDTLTANAKKAFIGQYISGAGFTFDDVAAAKGESESIETMRVLLATDPNNAKRIAPYIGGEEVNTSPTHAHRRYAIRFDDLPLRRRRFSPPLLWATAPAQLRAEMLRDGQVPEDYPDPVAADWPALLHIVDRLVRPARQALPPTNTWNRTVARRWWLWGAYRRDLTVAIRDLDRYLFVPNVAPHLLVTFISSQVIAGAPHNVIAYATFAPFAVLQSRVHELWARFFSSTLEDRLRYAPSDCFATFPFPPGFEHAPALEAAGRAYHDFRAELMVRRNQGLTKTYNRFHKPTDTAADIRELRRLHAAMDSAVLEAYGWDDLAERAEAVHLTPETEGEHAYQNRLFWPSDLRDEVLARLLKLNAARHADEQLRGLAPVADADDTDGEETEPEEEEGELDEDEEEEA